MGKILPDDPDRSCEEERTVQMTEKNRSRSSHSIYERFRCGSVERMIESSRLKRKSAGSHPRDSMGTIGTDVPVAFLRSHHDSDRSTSDGPRSAVAAVSTAKRRRGGRPTSVSFLFSAIYAGEPRQIFNTSGRGTIRYSIISEREHRPTKKQKGKGPWNPPVAVAVYGS